MSTQSHPMARAQAVLSERYAEGGPVENLRELLVGNGRQRPEDAIGFWMWRLTLVFQRRAESALKQMGLTHLQYVILTLTGWLSLQSSQVSQRDLARMSGVQEAQVSLMIKALKAKKLIKQTPGMEDTRVRWITITPAGVRLLSKSIPLMTALQDEMWPPGDDTDHVRHLFAKTLNRWEKRA